jgi:hypothetical protein
VPIWRPGSVGAIIWLLLVMPYLCCTRQQSGATTTTAGTRGASDTSSSSVVLKDETNQGYNLLILVQSQPVEEIRRVGAYTTLARLSQFDGHLTILRCESVSERGAGVNITALARFSCVLGVSQHANSASRIRAPHRRFWGPNQC